MNLRSLDTWRGEARAAGPVLDSLVDACAFGLAPAALLYAYVGTHLALLVALSNACVCVLRLAYFERFGLTSVESSDYYVGLPVTYSALFIPLAFVARSLTPDPLMGFVLLGVCVLLAAAMASCIPVRKLRGIWYVIFAAGAVALVLYHGPEALAEWGSDAG